MAHIGGPWVSDSIKLYTDLRTGSQYVGNWASSTPKLPDPGTHSKP